MIRPVDMQTVTHLAHTPPVPTVAPTANFDLAECLAGIEAMVPPLWPLKDYVAVNPFLGLSHCSFLTARRMLRQVRDCELLPSADYFRAQLQRGEITREDVDSACRQCAQQYPEHYDGLDAEWILQQLAENLPTQRSNERHFVTFAEFLDRHLQSNWASHIVNDISRHCGAYYDEGQASWPHPWKHLSLYQAWRESALVSRRMCLLGVRAFRPLVDALPSNPREAIAQLLKELQVPSQHCSAFLQCQIFSAAGWASFVKQRSDEEKKTGRDTDDLLGLLAIRLAYDVALLRSQQNSIAQAFTKSLHSQPAQLAVRIPDEVLARYALQVAAETAYRRRLIGQVRRDAMSKQGDRKALQMVFCIDVRSEVMRRHLEATSPAVETFGFAGFFGMALEYVPLGESSGNAQCPVLLTPAFRVDEHPLGCDQQTLQRFVAARGVQRTFRKAWKAFQSSAVSCYSFVESLGLLYFSKLLTDSLGLTRPVASASRDGIPRTNQVTLGPDLSCTGTSHLTFERKLGLAEGMLRNLGLTADFAHVVVICGHAAEVVNNPYKAGLDCGACGGHSGEPNARVAAALLNDSEIRQGLHRRGIQIPDDTWFVPAVHNTTTDEVRLLDTEQVPSSFHKQIAQVRAWLAEAGARCRAERCTRLGTAKIHDVFRRRRDWSEVRPEWGLAGNAAFIVAPRWRTSGLNLGGRVFMHSYDHAKDRELKVLELIMTAPMIVTSWINLQYFASTVDNRSFGSGNKTIHNVVGQFGVLAGNGGDLQTGLPWQSVHDGVQLQHQPLRLLVLIEASRQAVQTIIEKHPMVRDLASNGWLTVVVLENEQFYLWSGADGFVAETSDRISPRKFSRRPEARLV